VHRVGLDYVKSKIVEDGANRKTLFERLLFALQDYKDPWAERGVRDGEAELRAAFENIPA